MGLEIEKRNMVVTIQKLTKFNCNWWRSLKMIIKVLVEIINSENKIYIYTKTVNLLLENGSQKKYYQSSCFIERPK